MKNRDIYGFSLLVSFVFVGLILPQANSGVYFITVLAVSPFIWGAFAMITALTVGIKAGDLA